MAALQWRCALCRWGVVEVVAVVVAVVVSGAGSGGGWWCWLVVVVLAGYMVLVGAWPVLTTRLGVQTMPRPTQ